MSMCFFFCGRLLAQFFLVTACNSFWKTSSTKFSGAFNRDVSITCCAPPRSHRFLIYGGMQLSRWLCMYLPLSFFFVLYFAIRSTRMKSMVFLTALSMTFFQAYVIANKDMKNTWDQFQRVCDDQAISRNERLFAASFSTRGLVPILMT